MPTISPTYAAIKHSQTRQYTGTGITTPVWTLYGPGSLSQTGLYTAPPTGWAECMVSYHSNSWDYFPPIYFQKNADDSLTKTTSVPAYYGQVTSAARLNSAFDYVEYYAHTVNPYWVGVRNLTGTMEFVYSLNGNSVREYHPSGPLVTSGVFGMGAGDLIRIEILAGGQLRFSVNGVAQYTSVYSYHTNPLLFEVDGVANAGTVYLPPRFNGPTISNYSHAEASAFVQPDLLLPPEGLEIYCEPHLMTGANGSAVSKLIDFSGYSRHLTAATAQPTLQTGVQGGKSVVRFNGSQQPLKNSSYVPVKCGWVVAKYSPATQFSGYRGLLTSWVNWGILVGNTGDNKWYDFQFPSFETRSDDRIYPNNLVPGPMQQFRIVFFRFWGGALLLDGVQLGADRNQGRLWEGDVALLALYNREFSEEEIYANTKALAANFALGTLAPDVYRYQADVADTAETALQGVNIYDPPDGARIAEVLGAPKRLLDLKFSMADAAEVRDMKTFHKNHYPDATCFYRDYRLVPPEDIEGYIDSPYQLEGSGHDFAYSFTFREK